MAICDRVATTGVKLRPMIVRRSSMAKTSEGFAIATSGTPSSIRIGSTMWWRATDSGSNEAARWSSGNVLRSTKSRPTSLAMPLTRSSSVASPLLNR